MQTNLIKQCNFIHLSLRSLLQGENTALIDESRKQSVRTSFITSWIWHSPLHYLVRIRHRLLFEFRQKTTKNCNYIAHGEEYLPTFSLRYAALTFSQVCALGGVLVLVFASYVSKLLFWERRKSLIFVTIAEKIKKNGKLWQFAWLYSAIVK